jgi:hypothetical protein
MAIARFARTISVIAKKRAGFLCFLRQKEPETIWLHSFCAGRTFDNAYLLASLLVLHRDKPKALVGSHGKAPGCCRPEGYRMLMAIPLR